LQKRQVVIEIRAEEFRLALAAVSQEDGGLLSGHVVGFGKVPGVSTHVADVHLREHEAVGGDDDTGPTAGVFIRPLQCRLGRAHDPYDRRPQFWDEFDAPRFHSPKLGQVRRRRDDVRRRKNRVRCGMCRWHGIPFAHSTIATGTY
jgi:hypothetical protein